MLWFHKAAVVWGPLVSCFVIFCVFFVFNGCCGQKEGRLSPVFVD